MDEPKSPGSLCHTQVPHKDVCSSHCISATTQDKQRLHGTLRCNELKNDSLESTCPTSRTCKSLGSGNRQRKSDLLYSLHNLFQLFPLCPHYRTLYTQTTRHKSSSFPQAITQMNVCTVHLSTTCTHSINATVCT